MMPKSVHKKSVTCTKQAGQSKGETTFGAEKIARKSAVMLSTTSFIKQWSLSA
ncbi:hypothetical protein [Gracilibacillus alcaliphilus]|uniref:hypothetical protein n=1 Tax=Gracilibacillus alcaliphilus TaxID=1401441 RepID=UPI0019584EA0|nr:hypothetical protein [Gracilibacillus alcaliphilus]MBM7678067.1 hypothetical protein [Gracilibacillus alcaliphilus]